MIMKERTDGADLPTNTINYENDDSKNDLSTIAEEERPSSYSTNRRRRILEAIWQKRTNYPIDKQNRRRYRWRQPDDQYHIRLQLSTERTTIERLEILSTKPDYPSRPKTLKIEYLWIHKNKRTKDDITTNDTMNDDTTICDLWHDDKWWTMNDGWRMIVTRQRLAEPMERNHEHQNEHSSTFDLEWFKNDSTLIY